MTFRAAQASHRRPTGRTVPSVAFVLVALAVALCWPATVGASATVQSPRPRAASTVSATGDGETSVATVDQTPIVSVAARRDTNGLTVPLMLVGTAAMLALGFGMLAVRCVRAGPAGS